MFGDFYAWGHTDKVPRAIGLHVRLQRNMAMTLLLEVERARSARTGETTGGLQERRHFVMRAIDLKIRRGVIRLRRRG